MKFLSYFIFAVAIISFTACSGDKKSDTSREPLTTTPSTDIQQNPTATTNAGVSHYTCPNNCEGSGGASAGTCPVCGTAYAHNQAFHSQPNTQTQTNPIQLENPTPPAGITPPSTPSQNTAGVFHYICSNGCAGGAGGAGACATCGAALTHNQAYH